MTLDIVGVIASLVVLAVAGDQFIIAISRIAASLEMRPTIVGALVGGFGTSIVELIVAALAVAPALARPGRGQPGRFDHRQRLPGLAVAALIAPIRVDSATLRREAPLSVASVGLFALLAVGGITVAKGIVLCGRSCPCSCCWRPAPARGTGDEEMAVELAEFVGTVGHGARTARSSRAIASLALMLGGAELMVRSTVSLSDRLGWAQSFAGVTLVGIGTSAPLIASSIQGARRGEHDLVVGNVLGGNLFIALAAAASPGF